MHRVPAVRVTTTEAVAYRAIIGITRRPRWSHASGAATGICQDVGAPQGRKLSESHHGSFQGCTTSISTTRVPSGKAHEHQQKGLGIKVVFSLAPLPLRPCMGESPCSVGGGVIISNHQFPRQTNRGQDTRGHDPSWNANR